MNSCEYYQELISRLADGEISRGEYEALMAHMESCSRCSAMYAVFHDLSDILSEECEELPEGLHENIMAGVRRSHMIKKNRRMRSFGLRMAMGAAACALLVLFAATGFGPGKRAESGSIRTREEAEQLMQAAPAAETPSAELAAPAAPLPNVYSAPVESSAPNPVWYATPAPTWEAPATADVYYTGWDSADVPSYTPQPEQNYIYQAANPTPAYTPAPVPVQSAAPVLTPAPAQVPEEAAEDQAQAETANASFRRAAPVIEAAPDETAAAAAEDDAAALLQGSATELFQSAGTESAGRGVAAQAEGSAEPEQPATEGAVSEDEDVLSSLFGGVVSLFNSEAPEEAELPDGDASTAESALPDAVWEQAAPDEEEAIPETVSAPEENPAYTEWAPAPAETGADAAAVSEQRVSIRGKEARSKLFALLGDSEEALPAEAALTRVVHIALVPEDAYGSEEKLDVCIYGDFVYYRLFSVSGDVTTFRANCALRDLDSFLQPYLAPAASESPGPWTALTADPFAAEVPETQPAEAEA